MRPPPPGLYLCGRHCLKGIKSALKLNVELRFNITCIIRRKKNNLVISLKTKFQVPTQNPE